MSRDEIAELINRRRRQVLIHSIIYYGMSDNLITDATWNSWARELADIQRQYPDIAATCWKAEVFDGFDPASGYYLPLDEQWAVDKARYLLRISKQQNTITNIDNKKEN